MLHVTLVHQLGKQNEWGRHLRRVRSTQNDSDDDYMAGSVRGNY